MYFQLIFPKLKEKYKDYLREIIFIQRPGEVVFIPGSWWHVVVNLDNTIAVTQNYVNSVNFANCWKYIRKERKKMACKLLKKLEQKSPEVYKFALEMNKNDGFIMYNELKMLQKKRISEDGNIFIT
jgi:histone arginine demethylase JMJD6